jgi:hypothetical protein
MVAAFTAGLFACSVASATGWLEKSVQGNPDTYRFGNSLAVTSSKLLVGAPGEDSARGAVYAYTNVSGEWNRTQVIQPSDSGLSDYFGYSVAISGTTAVIGAYVYGGPSQPSTGKAYIYDYVNGAWTETAVLHASDEHIYNFFGYSVAIAGSTVLIGAPHMAGTTPGPGAVYVFNRGPLASWTQTQILTSHDGGTLDRFGYSIAMNGTTALVGAPRLNNLNPRPGAAYVFTASSGTWSEQQEIAASTYQILDEFGTAVALSGNVAVVGAPTYEVNGNANQGKAFVFRLAGGTWSQTQAISIAQGSAHDLFGSSAALSNGTLLVGASEATILGQANQGAAYLFADSGTTFTLSHRFTASDGDADDMYGASLALPPLAISQTSTLLIGAVNKDDSGSLRGKVYYYIPN